MKTTRFILGGIALAAQIVIGSAGAAIHCVNTAGTDGCSASIREAVNAAASGDTIVIDRGFHFPRGTIHVSKSLSFIGAGRDATIVDGSQPETLINGDTIFHVMVEGSPVRVFFWNLAIQRGCNGIFVGKDAEVTLDSIRVAGNGPCSGAGLYASPGADVAINSSLIIGNRATDPDVFCGGAAAGGGIAMCGSANGTLRISNSAFVGNSASGRGGGIAISDGDVWIVNSTFSDNAAPSGGGMSVLQHPQFDGSTVTFVQHTTLGGNAGASNVDFDGNWFVLANSIVSVASGGGAACSWGRNRAVGISFSVLGDSSCGDGPGTGNVIADPRLDGLAENGGPTPTHALNPNSPAIDRVPRPDCFVASDQRGNTRFSGPGCDSGAFER